MYSYTYMLTPLHQFENKLTKNFPTNICLFKIRIGILRSGVKGVQGQWKRPIIPWKETSKTMVNFF